MENCNFLPTSNNERIFFQLRPKQTVVVFYRDFEPVRLLAVDGRTDLDGIIQAAMTAELGEILHTCKVSSETIDLGETRLGDLPACYQRPEIDFFSCNRWSLFRAALNGQISDSANDATGAGNDDPAMDFTYDPGTSVIFQLTTDTELFTITHQGIYLNHDRSRIIAPQIGSSLAPR